MYDGYIFYFNLNVMHSQKYARHVHIAFSRTNILEQGGV